MEPVSSVDLGPMIPNKVDSFPIKPILHGGLVDDIHTDVAIMEFDNKLFIIITQYQKIGTMIQVRRDAARTESEAISVFNTETVFGKDEMEHHLIGRMLAEKIQITKPLLLSLALQKSNKSQVQKIVHHVSEVYFQGNQQNS